MSGGVVGRSRVSFLVGSGGRVGVIGVGRFGEDVLCYRFYSFFVFVGVVFGSGDIFFLWFFVMFVFVIVK